MVPRFTFREAVAEATIHNGPYYILGRELDPFCYRHFRFLEDYGSPLIHGGGVTILDLQIAVLVCSTPDMKSFREALSRRSIYWKVWGRITSAWLPAVHVPRFRTYIGDYFPEFPMYTPPGSDAEDEGIPAMTIAAARCLPSFGYEKTTSMGLGEMIVWSMAIAEANGRPFDNIMKAVDIEGLREIEAEEKIK